MNLPPTQLKKLHPPRHQSLQYSIARNKLPTPFPPQFRRELHNHSRAVSDAGLTSPVEMPLPSLGKQGHRRSKSVPVESEFEIITSYSPDLEYVENVEVPKTVEESPSTTRVGKCIPEVETTSSSTQRQTFFSDTGSDIVDFYDSEKRAGFVGSLEWETERRSGLEAA